MIRKALLLLVSAFGFAQNQDDKLQKLVEDDKVRIANRPALTEQQKKECIQLKKLNKRKPFRFGIVSTSPEFKFEECRAELMKSLICIDPVDLGIKAVDTKQVETAAAGSDEELKFVAALADAKSVKDNAISGLCIIIKSEGKFTPGTCFYPHQVSHTIPYCIVPVACPAKVLLHEIGHMMGLDHHKDFDCVMYTGTEFCPVCLYLTGSLSFYDDKVDELPARVSLKKGECFTFPMGAHGAERLGFIFQDNALVIVHTAGEKFHEFFTIDGKTSDRITPYSRPPLAAKKAGCRDAFITDVFVEKESCCFSISEDAQLTPLEEYLLSKRGILIDNSNE